MDDRDGNEQNEECHRVTVEVGLLRNAARFRNATPARPKKNAPAIPAGAFPTQIETRSWLGGDGPFPQWFKEKDNPVWSRHYSDEPDDADCELLTDTLRKLGAKRMIVGHTVQENGITSYCDGKVWCIDVGMAAHYGGDVEVLEIRGDMVRGISER